MNILMTGAFSAIAQAVVRCHAAQGDHVMISDLRGQREGDALTAALGQTVSYMPCDTSDSAQCDAVVAAAVKAFGQLDVVYVHAGISNNHAYWDMPDEAWRKVIDVNLTGSFFMARAATRAMMKNSRSPSGRRGTIIFTSTWVAKMPWPCCVNYCASKAGVDALVRGMAQEAATHGITVNAVAPGFVGAGATQHHYDTSPDFKRQVDDTVPLGRMCSPEELASLFVYLASEQAAYITGVTIPFDGGATIVNRSNWLDS